MIPSIGTISSGISSRSSTNPLVEFIGEIGETQKNEFLGHAKALLFPIDWPEPFGLVMIEALACGVPVIAFRGGSVPEVIDDGVTGFIVDTLDGAIDATRKSGMLDRRAVPGSVRAPIQRDPHGDGLRAALSGAHGANIRIGGRCGRRLMAEALRLDEQFAILTETDRSTAPLRVLKYGDTFAVFDPHGDLQSLGSQRARSVLRGNALSLDM